MEAPALDVTFDAEIDTYIVDEPSPSPPPTDRDSIARDKERLQRFHKEAISFLTKAYSNDDAVLVEDRFDNSARAAHSAEDFLAQRRVDLDRVRLERFHAQAVSFLDRAYADEPGTIVEEETLSPGGVLAPAQDREMLQRFHAEAMSFLDAAAGGGNDAGDGEPWRDAEATSGNEYRRRADRTSLRIERDKARLEQHYQDAMSFLKRAEAGQKGVLVEEQELESSVVERLQLQKYAQDAMSFLDKAFRNDESIMVGDDDEALSASADQEVDDYEDGYVHGAESGHQRDFGEELSAQRGSGANARQSGAVSVEGSEDRQIAADRAALERYDEEFKDFLSKAYLDDSTVIVEDAESETSGTDRGLFARRMAPSTTSADTGDTGYSDGAPFDDDSGEEAYTDDEFQDPSVAESSRLELLHGDLPGSRADGLMEDNDENVRSRVARYEREAADYLNGATVSVEGEDDDGVGSQGNHSHAMSAIDNANYEAPTDVKEVRRQDHDRHELVEEDVYDDEEFGADQHVDDETIPKAFYDEETGGDGRATSLGKFEVQSSKYPDRIEMPRPSSAFESTTRSPGSQDLMMDLILNDNSGRNHAWSEVPLERSFYRQVPRGSTIKLRPRVSPQLFPSSTAETGVSQSDSETVPLADLHRVERERDAVMASLEEIVNERSMLAAQVSDMKAMITNSDGSKGADDKSTEEFQDIDLAAELKDAHATMAKLTEEMEATLSVLDSRYQETLERAHRAEERCIRLESAGSRLEKEFAQQGRRLSQAIAEESRLRASLTLADRDLEALRRKRDSDLKELDEKHREELDRSVQKILELTTEVSALEGKVQKASFSSSPRGSSSHHSEQELELSRMKRRAADLEKCIADERTSSKEKLQAEIETAVSERERDLEELTERVEQLSAEAQRSEGAKNELRRVKAESVRHTARIDELQLRVEEVTRALKSAKRSQVTAEAEAQHIRSRYEESLKKRISRMDQKAEMVELQTALEAIKEEAGARELRLQRQLAEFRGRAEQAEAAAARAEKDANEAAGVARLTQERSRAVVEAERKARKAAEAEKALATQESKAWEKFAQQQMDMNTKTEDSSETLVKSSSRRGLRRSPSKGERSKKKREGGKSAAAGEEAKKKVSMRPRLFG